MLVLGVVFTDGFVWPGCAHRLPLRRLVDRALATVAVLGGTQVLILASDISGDAPWNSFGSLDAAMGTDAGRAFALRILIAGCAWLVFRRMELQQHEVRWTAVGVVGAALMATWAFAGHSASQRWQEFGVAVDVIHHSAAATWVGGLAVVGLFAASTASPDEMTDILRRFARTAATSVALVVSTGILQSVRLVGNPAGLFDGAHGRLLLVKLAALAVMLAAANANRTRVLRGTHQPEGISSRSDAAIRQTIAVELLLGVLILAITSAMVVSSPASADQAAPAPPRTSLAADSYTV
jgi:copper transport protein